MKARSAAARFRDAGCGIMVRIYTYLFRLSQQKNELREEKSESLAVQQG
jgi:hypothetical protein